MAKPKAKTVRTMRVEHHRWSDKSNEYVTERFIVPLFKVLGRDGTAPYSSSTIWQRNRPRGGKRGKWVSVPGKLIICRNGLHLTPDPWLWGARWSGSKIYLAEYRGQKVTRGGYGDKICVRHARLIRSVTRREAKRLMVGKRVK